MTDAEERRGDNRLTPDDISDLKNFLRNARAGGIVWGWATKVCLGGAIVASIIYYVYGISDHLHKVQGP